MSRRSILLIVALIVAALGTTMIVLYVNSIDARAAQGQEQVKVLTATEVIDAGETVAKAQAAGKLEKTDVVREDMVEGALTSTTSIEDQVSLGTIYPGEQIISSKFGAPGSADTLSIPDDKLAISVELTDPARVAGFVNPGSEVAIFVSADPFLMKPDGSKTGAAAVHPAAAAEGPGHRGRDHHRHVEDRHHGRGRQDDGAGPAHDPDRRRRPGTGREGHLRPAQR